ncbi:MAG: hypothetical protein ACKO2P_21045 [Planctomycetota bacterium]
MRFVRLGLAFSAAALFSGCQSLRKQPPATLDPVRIPPAREGEYAPERPRPRPSLATEPEEAPSRGPVKSIGWPRFSLRREQSADVTPNEQLAATARPEIPVQTVSNPLTERMRKLFKASADPECTDHCDGSPHFQMDSPGAFTEPALTPRGPASVRADYGQPGPRVTPVPDAGPAPIPGTAPGRPQVPAPAVKRPPQVFVEDAPSPGPPPAEPALRIPPATPRRTPAPANPEESETARPSLPSVLVEDPPAAVPPVPATPAVPELPPAVPENLAFPDPPTFPRTAPPEVPANPDPTPKSSKSSTKTKTKSTTPRKSTVPRSTEEDAVLEERLRQSAERARSNAPKSSGTTPAPAQQNPQDSGDATTDPPLWPKRFGGSPPVGEPVLDPLPEPPNAPTPAPANPTPAPANPMPAPAAPVAPMPQPPVIPETPADAPPAIPGLPPTIDLDDEIPRPPRTPPASPSPTSFRSRPGRSI